MHPYDGKDFYLITKHGKEVAFTGQNPFHDSKIVTFFADTDVLGTFSPETKRKQGIKETLKLKAQLLPSSLGRLVIASEGTFGPHPDLPFLMSDHEVLYFYDREMGIEFFVDELSSETNLAERTFTSLEGLESFLSSVLFPSHAVNVFTSDLSLLEKGLTDFNSVVTALEECWRLNREAIIQTDMRADNNPSRMKVIQKAAVKLFNQLQSLCPTCSTPGVQVLERKIGLECELCGNETKCLKEIIYGCLKCPWREIKSMEELNIFANPEFCDYCNP